METLSSKVHYELRDESPAPVRSNSAPVSAEVEALYSAYLDKVFNKENAK